MFRILAPCFLGVCVLPSLALAADPFYPAASMGNSSLALRGSIGLTYWYSQASMKVGGDLSEEASDIKSHSAELTFGVDDLSAGSFFKGTVGIGMDRDGSYEIGASTADSFDDGSFGFLTLDGGFRLMNSPQAQLKAVLGYQYLSNDMSAQFGAVDYKVDYSMHLMRAGLTAEGTFTDRLGWTAELVGLPFGYTKAGNQEAKYTYGFEAEAGLNLVLTQNWDIGVGARYWLVKSTFEEAVDYNVTYRRYGALLNSSYRF